MITNQQYKWNELYTKAQEQLKASIENSSNERTLNEIHQNVEDIK